MVFLSPLSSCFQYHHLSFYMSSWKASELVSLLLYLNCIFFKKNKCFDHGITLLQKPQKLTTANKIKYKFLDIP